MSRRYCSSTSPPRESTSSFAATCGNWCASCAQTAPPIILTTHYIEEAEELADRVGVITNGELVAVDDKAQLMKQLGKKRLDILLAEPLAEVPPELSEWSVALEDDGHRLCYTFDSHAERTGIASLMKRLGELGITYKDLSTDQSSLEDIFVELVHRGRVQPEQAA